MNTEKKRFRFVAFLLLYVLPVLLSGIVRALAIYIFVTPNKFAPGGFNGLSVILEEITTINSGWFLLIFNVPLFFLAFFLLGKREAIVSTASMLLSSGLLIVFGYIDKAVGFPQYGNAAPGEGATVAGLLAAVASGILLGVSLATLLRSCGTSGGTSIIASIIHKKFKHLSVSWLTFGFDAIVVVASVFVYNRTTNDLVVRLDPVFLALISLFVTSKVSDIILHGFTTAYKFEIVSGHADEIAQEIMEKTHHGVTMIRATGMYTHEEKDMLVCIIRKRQIAQVQRIIRKYPDTFAYFSQTSEVYGKFAK